jgi:hypothetical protein
VKINTNREQNFVKYVYPNGHAVMSMPLKLTPKPPDRKWCMHLRASVSMPLTVAGIYHAWAKA